ncbi:hypothetical protein MRX96_035275 [Rhipicephalus microplus]
MKKESRCQKEAEKWCNRKIAQMLKLTCQQANREPKKMQSTRLQHSKLTKNLSEYEIQVRNLMLEVVDVKNNERPLVTK